ncbi:nickel pincer cofactor biosynthesis protein LarB [Methanobrevibacter sp.]|uniref:nickel pincer cofactor biosynthesis protein LarB n=1 Tax=Methanobrevibacter sp. TaxID=66852 RepID=UPI0038900F40
MREILEKLINEEIDLETAENLIKSQNILELDEVAKLDSNRQIRTGFPEAVFAPSKDYEDLLFIVKRYFESENPQNLIITKLTLKRYEKLLKDLEYLEDLIFDYNKKGQILVIKVNETKSKPIAKIGILTAGTSDINVAEEAKVIIEESGCEAITSYDIGVAGIHRLFPQIAYMVKEGVKVLIVCAGMEGALPSVVAGLVDIPVIAVPTSVGYGVGEGGRVALDSMLQSCAPGIAVVNIDNGFGAAVFALTIVKSR